VPKPVLWQIDDGASQRVGTISLRKQGVICYGRRRESSPLMDQIIVVREQTLAAVTELLEAVLF
jgi:hypothetical protein